MFRTCFITAAALLAAATVQAQALALQDLPDDTRATVKKELARKVTVADAKDNAAVEGPTRPGGRSQSGCAMTIGSPESPSRGKRDVVVVVTKPIVQLCH